MNRIANSLKDKIEDDIEPETVGRVISDILYKSNLMCYPVVAGLGVNGPYLCSMDGLGAQTQTYNFVASGSSSSALLTACEYENFSDSNPSKLVSISKLA